MTGEPLKSPGGRESALNQSDNFLNASSSDLPKVMIVPGPDADVLSLNFFSDFDFAQPPPAELKILRVLENHIQRKKRDQKEQIK